MACRGGSGRGAPADGFARLARSVGRYRGADPGPPWPLCADNPVCRPAPRRAETGTLASAALLRPHARGSCKLDLRVERTHWGSFAEFLLARNHPPSCRPNVAKTSPQEINHWPVLYCSPVQIFARLSNGRLCSTRSAMACCCARAVSPQCRSPAKLPCPTRCCISRPARFSILEHFP